MSADSEAGAVPVGDASEVLVSTSAQPGFMVRDLRASDVHAAVTLHCQVLDMEFISRCGPAFVRTYYRAWLEAPGSLALAAEGSRGELAGMLLGALDPAGHTTAMVRSHLVPLAGRMVVAAVTRPALARELVVTRSARYARALRRALAGKGGQDREAVPETVPPPGSPGRVGEVTHLLVDPSWQGRGVGRALLEAAAARGRHDGLSELMLVTPPDLAARGFYQRMGWVAEGAVTSRSGEPFIRYRFRL